MATMERDIERSLINMVRIHGGMCLKWVCPGWAGVPDRIILMPGGRVIFVELKRPKGGVLSSRQVWWMKKLRGLGFAHCEIWSFDELRLFEEVVLHG